MPDTTLHLAIAAPLDVARDVKKNSPWVLAIAGALCIYVLASAWLASLFEGWTYLHSCYFTVINITTVGFGDVVHVTHPGKLLAGFNAFVGLILFGSFVAALTMAFQPSSWSGTLTVAGALAKAAAGEDAPSLSSAIENLFRGLGNLTGAMREPYREQRATESYEGHDRTRITIHRHDPNHVVIDIIR